MKDFKFLIFFFLCLIILVLIIAAFSMHLSNCLKRIKQIKLDILYAKNEQEVQYWSRELKYVYWSIATGIAPTKIKRIHKSITKK